MKIEKIKPTFVISTFKTVVTKADLVLLIFFIYKTAQGRKLVYEKNYLQFCKSKNQKISPHMLYQLL